MLVTNMLGWASGAAQGKWSVQNDTPDFFGAVLNSSVFN
jgi:hypothetical protein